MNEGKELLEGFGKKVRKARTNYGLSQLQLAEKTGLDRTYIGGIERGERNPSLTSFYKIATALKMKPEKLLPNSH